MKKKIGSGTLPAFLRQGVKELGSAAVSRLPDSIAPVDELGTLASPTPGEIAAQKEGRGFRSYMTRRPTLEQEPRPPEKDGPDLEP